MPIFSLRAATPNDAKAIGLIHTISWQAIYRGHFPDEFLDNIDAEARVLFWRKAIMEHYGETVVAHLEGRVIGFLHLIASRDDDAPTGTDEVTAIYLDPGKWRMGYGRQLMNWAKTQAAERHTKKITLWVLRENSRAREFYESIGFHFDGTSKSERLPDSAFIFTEVRYVFECDH